MKRLTLIGTIIALGMFTAPAVGQGVGIGVQAGPTFTTLAGDVEDTSMKTGFAVGAQFRVGLAPMFAIRPELSFVQRGTVVEERGVTTRFKATYTQFPVLFELSVPLPAGPRPYFYAGPGVSFEMSCELETELSGVTESAECNDPAADTPETKSMSVAFIGGAGMGFGVGVGEAFIDLRYDLGLTNLDDSTSNDEVRNRAFTLLVGITIGLGL